MKDDAAVAAAIGGTALSVTVRYHCNWWVTGFVVYLALLILQDWLVSFHNHHHRHNKVVRNATHNQLMSIAGGLAVAILGVVPIGYVLAPIGTAIIAAVYVQHDVAHF